MRKVNATPWSTMHPVYNGAVLRIFLWKGGIDHSLLILPNHWATDWRVLNILYKPITRYHDNRSPSIEEQIFGMMDLPTRGTWDSPGLQCPSYYSQYLVLCRLWLALPGTTSRQLRSISGSFIDKRSRVRILIHLSSHDLCKVADLHTLVAFWLLLLVVKWETHKI